MLAWISSTYGDMDRERYLIENAIAVSSSEMQELNASILEERDKFASIFEAAPSGIMMTNLEGAIVEVNGAFAAILGFSRAELVGRNVADLVEPAESDSVRDNVRKLASGVIAKTKVHRRLLNHKGELVLTDVRVQTMFDRSREPRMMLALIDDVTDRVRLEMELRHSQKLESVGRLAAGIAHEINTPIQFVGDNVAFLADVFEQLLSLCDTYHTMCQKAAASPLCPADFEQVRQREDAADLDYVRENVPDSIKSTIDGVTRVARIVQSMKAFAHPDRGERTVADINAALRDTLTVATNELKYVASVEVDFGHIPAVSCFLSDLNQVFLNLLVNAAHAIKDVVGKSGQRGLIRVRTYQERSHVVVAIGDTGSGIPPAIRGKIFDPFFTTKGVGKGTGQGLALAHSVVVEQHGGSITFETEPGRGTTFFVRIPSTIPEGVSKERHDGQQGCSSARETEGG
jgi:PAS domain S-box-containing protein